MAMTNDARLKLAAGEAEWNPLKGCLRIVASEPVVDHDNEVIDPRTIRLDTYRRNPVVIWAHEQKAIPIAKCEDPAGNFTCTVDDTGRLIQEWYFADTPAAREVALLYKQGVLRGASIGFKADGYQAIPAEKARMAFGVDRPVNYCLGGELLETSAVPIPSCPGALALGWIDAERGRVAMRTASGIVKKSLSRFLSLQVAGVGVKTLEHHGARPMDDKAKISNALTSVVEKLAAVGVEVEKKDANDTAGGRDGLEVPQVTEEEADIDEVEPHEKMSTALRGMAHDYVDKMFDSDDEAEHKACLESIKVAHGDHLRYKSMGTKGEEVESGSDDDFEPSDDAEEKAVSDLITKAMQDALAPLKAQIDQLAAWQRDFGTPEELAEALLSIR